VDNEGNFDSSLTDLKGKFVLNEGNAEIMNRLKNKVLSSSKIKHSYPYDWRTKKPVIVKTSMQWFIDTEELKAKALVRMVMKLLCK